MDPVEGVERLSRLLDAVMSLGSELDLHSTLRRVAAAAVELTGAGYGAFAVLDETGGAFSDFITVGVDDATRSAIGDLPTGLGVLGELIRSPEPVRLADLRQHPDSVGMPPHHPEMGPFLGIPVRVRNRVFGFLYLCGDAGSEEFDVHDERAAVSLATAGGVAIENASMHERFAEMVLVEERERIARELHDTVIQRLYGVGLTLQGSTRLTRDAALRARLETAVDDLDVTIRDIRGTIFELQTTRSVGSSVRQAVLELVAEATRSLGFSPEVRFVGPVDTAVSAATAEHMLLVLREALSNVARHAGATRATIEVCVEDDVVALSVSDDGIGPSVNERFSDSSAATDLETSGGQGLRNIAARAEKLGGTSSLAEGPTGGAVLRWTVPLDWLYSR
jgi:signal transduction histidine kinase